MVNKNCITIDYSRDDKLTDAAKATLRDRYMLPEEQSPQDAFARASAAYSDSPEMAQRIYDYVSNLWFMFSSPIISNGRTDRGLPISCYLNYVPDSRDGLSEHYDENIWLASNGGGVGGYWGDVRSSGTKTSKGSESTGSIPFMKVVDSFMLAFSQGPTRRGSYAAYQDISHPEIEEFIDMRDPSGGDANRKCLNLHHGVNITDAFMHAVKSGAPWNLVDPHSGEAVKTVDARGLFMKLLNKRAKTGEPYIHFIDTTNRALPEGQKGLGLKVRQSNLCSEITLPTDENRTAVCCLSSVNLEYFDEWRDNEHFIPDLIRFLDNVLEDFIIRGSKVDGLRKAVYSASQERSIGLGAMGFHSYLQKRGTPFDSPVVKGLNHLMFSNIKLKAELASMDLALERGKAPDADMLIRNCHLLAVAPNATSSIIAGTSPSIEPWFSNAYKHKTLSGSFLTKNKHLEENLRELGMDTPDVWKSIVTNRGSVQHLDIPADLKDVYKTATEIDQEWVIEHASDRQEHICQSQSVNLFFNNSVHVTKFFKIHLMAWEKGLKTLYYVRGEPTKGAEVVSDKVERVRIMDNDCIACEG